MPASRFSPDWHRGDASTFARLVGSSNARPINHDDPVHQARVQRYERNIEYYQLAQYSRVNEEALAGDNFLDLRVNYTSITKRAIDMKSDWLFGKPVGIHAIPLDDEGEFQEEQPPDEGIFKKVKDRVNQIREFNRSDFWDYIMSIMGMTCGDFFILVDAQADDIHPTISLQDPSYCFPDYPRDMTKPMRACQIQYTIDQEGDPTDEIGMTTRHIVEDYRLEVIQQLQGETIELEDLEVLSDEELDEIEKETETEGAPPDRLTCIYRKFEDGKLVEGSYRDIGVPAIPIIHGRNANIWNTRYGNDEVSPLIPLVEKYNETFFYAERVGRHNAHAKLFVSGVKSETSPIKGDYDDVIYGGDNSDAKVITLPTDISVLKFVTDTIEREMHRNAGIPVIAEGEAEQGYGAPSGLALMIRFGPLQALNARHTLSYGDALSATYLLCLMFDEMVIDGSNFGTKWSYDQWKFKFDWHDAMPKAISEIITDMIAATAGKPLLSVRTAQEHIPGIDPDQELERLREEVAQAGQTSLAGDGSVPPGFENLDGLPTAAPTTFPASWTIRKDVVRDEFGRIDHVIETATPGGDPLLEAAASLNGNTP